MKRLIFGLGFLLHLAYASGPRVLIFQPNDAPATLNLDEIIASQLIEKFNVEPIVWSMTDPIFRQAVTAGDVTVDVAKAGLPEVRSSMKSLNATYLFVVSPKQQGKSIVASGQLFQGTSSRTLWQMSTNMNAEIAEVPDLDAAQASIARTWLVNLANTAWKNYAMVDGISTPAASSGVDFTPTPAPQEELDQLLAKARALSERNDLKSAVITLFEAVDIAPTNLEARKLLIHTLRRAGLAEQAGLESQRALLIAPEDLDLRLEALRVLIASGKLEDARTELVIALSKNPNHPAVQLLLGDLCLFSGQLDQAKQAYLKSQGLSPNPVTQLSLALIIAADGDTAEVLHLLAESGNVSPEEVDALSDKFWIGGKLIAANLASEAANCVVKVRTASNRGPLAVQAQLLVKRAEALSLLADRFPVSESRKPTIDARRLAHKLLVQALGDILEFARTGDPEFASQAQISLSDAMSRF